MSTIHQVGVFGAGCRKLAREVRYDSVMTVQISPCQPETPLDAGIAPYVQILHGAGIETYESCEGGEGHCFPEPTIRFHGDRSEGLRALAIAQQHAMPVSSIRRAWPIVDGEPTGPIWEMTFSAKSATGPLR